MAQIAVRLSDSDLGQLDALVSSGRFASRAEAVRAGVGLLARQLREEGIERSYRDAYEAMPLTDDEHTTLDAAAALASDLR